MTQEHSLDGPAEGSAAGIGNVVCVLLDSLVRDRLGCYGGEQVATPHLDRFARRSGVRR